MSKQNGVTLIPANTPLTRLNYFDGKFLRAADLQAEQNYLRNLVHLSNQADGAGVAHGFSLSLGTSDTLNVGDGLAIDPQGRVLLLPQSTNVSIAELVRLSKNIGTQSREAIEGRPGGFEDCLPDRAEPPTNTLPGSELYLIVICHTEALCGQEDVYGKLCEEACSTSTDRPYRVEGLVIRAVPLQLRTPLLTSSVVQLTRAHQRSLIASAYFNDEREKIASFISKAGLSSEMWCFGAEQAVGNCVPLGVLAHAGTSTLFLDAWTARRERIDTPAKRYWQWRMAMRPWDVFLAQILQFQCQLHDLYENAPEPGDEGDPCREERQLLAEAAKALAEFNSYHEEVTGHLNQVNPSFRLRFQQEYPTLAGGITQINDLRRRLLSVEKPFTQATRLLIRGGIVELPSAGYLPVTPGEAETINRQVRRLMGEGVDLRFCVVRPDYVAHALEQAQHMERISLLEGLDHPERKPEVDILVPNGQVLEDRKTLARNIFEASFTLDSTPGTTGNNPAGQPANPAGGKASGPSGPFGAGPNVFIEASGPSQAEPRTPPFEGAARTELLSTGGAALYLAVLLDLSKPTNDEGIRVGIASGASADAAARGFAMGPEDSAQMPVMDETLFPAFLRDLIAGSLNPEPEKGAAQARAQGRTPMAVGRNQRIVALWMTLRCDKNIFALERNETSHVEVFALLTISGVVIEVRLQGDFLVEQAATDTADARELSGRLSVLGFAQIIGDTSQPRSAKFNFDVSLSLTRPLHSALTTVEITGIERKWGIHADVVAKWGGDPLQITASFGYTKNGSSSEQMALTLKSNPEVFEPNNESHAQALTALNIVGVGLDDASFIERASLNLFPPPPPPSEELLVRGMLDWVLFHRRRTSRCSPDVPPPTPAAARRYALYSLKLRGRSDFEKLIEALRSSDDATLEKFDFRRAAIVEFGAGVAALVSDQEEIKTDWESTEPGETLLYGAIMSRGAAAGEGNALAQARLSRLEQVVLPTVAEGAENEVLPNVPATLSTNQAADGTIVLITEDQAVQTICHSVYRAPDTRMYGIAIQEILSLKGMNPPDTRIRDILAHSQIMPLVNAQFKAGSAEEMPGSLQAVKADWVNKGGGLAPIVALIAPLGDSQPDDDMRTQQARKIAEQINNPATIAVNVQPFKTPAALPTNCPVFSIIVAEQVGSSGPSGGPSITAPAPTQPSGTKVQPKQPTFSPTKPAQPAQASTAKPEESSTEDKSSAEQEADQPAKGRSGRKKPRG
jgi:hypothetical protein